MLQVWRRAGGSGRFAGRFYHSDSIITAPYVSSELFCEPSTILSFMLFNERRTKAESLTLPRGLVLFLLSVTYAAART
jgi:hypothetical protein